MSSGPSPTPNVAPPDQQDRQLEYRRLHPEPAAPLIEAKRLLVWANVTDDALAQADTLPAGVWTHLVTADNGVWAPDAAVVDHLAKTGLVLAWCDCRDPNDPDNPGTSAQAAIDLAHDPDLQLHGWVGQAESVTELRNSVGISEDGALVAPQGTERARIIIGNPNAWTADQRATATRMIKERDLAVVAEVYEVDPGYSAQGVPVSSVLYGVAMDKGVYIPLIRYLAEMPVAYRASFGVWHAAGLEDEAWSTMRVVSA